MMDRFNRFIENHAQELSFGLYVLNVGCGVYMCYLGATGRKSSARSMPEVLSDYGVVGFVLKGGGTHMFDE